MKAQRVNLEGYRQVSFVRLPFIDFAGNIEHRWLHMNGVIQAILDKYPAPSILDVASGGGHDTIFLLQKGYNVTSNEVDSDFTTYLEGKIKAAGVEPRVLHIDWRDFLTSSELKDNTYDILFALGNSFPNYLFNKEERERSLRGFWRVLKPGGTLFFDTRNYDYILSEAPEILKDPEHNYHFTYQNTYTNRDIVCFPTEIISNKVRLQYKHQRRKTATYLDLYPTTVKEVTDLVNKSLSNFDLQIYYDYKLEKPEHFDFVQYVLTKHH